LALAGDVDLYRLNIPTACVEPGYMRTWHKEQATVRIIRPRVNDILTDGVDEHRQTAELVEAEEARHWGAALDGERRDLYAIVSDRRFDIGHTECGSNNPGKQLVVEFAEDEVSGRNDT